MKFDEYDEYDEYDDYYSPHTCCASYNMLCALPYVHYSDPYWNEARTVWGAEEKDLIYNYSDRLWEWNHDKVYL